MSMNFEKIFEGQYNIKLVRSKRRTLSIEIKKGNQITVRAPLRLPEKYIEEFLIEKKGWIDKKILEYMANENMQKPAKEDLLYSKDIRELAMKARHTIPDKVEYYAKMIGVTYGRISIKLQKTIWGSCSSNGNLNFNCLLMTFDNDIIDYVIVHELCHRIYMNHSKAYWQEVKKVMPDYKERRKRLKLEGNYVMSRVYERN